MKRIAILLLLICSFSFARAQCDQKVLEAFGGMSAMAIYNTYVTIGAIADGYGGEIYDAAYVQELMNEQTVMIGSLIDMLAKCRDTENIGLSEEDLAYVEDLIDCLEILKKEAQSLSDYSRTGSEEAENAYHMHRELAWEQIADLLGLEDE